MIDIIYDTLTWSKDKCLRTHHWAWITSSLYNCPICKWGIGYEESWLLGKPVGGA
jgi:hypothetical protein